MMKLKLNATMIELGLIGALVGVGMTIVGIAVACSELFWK